MIPSAGQLLATHVAEAVELGLRLDIAGQRVGLEEVRAFFDARLHDAPPRR